MTAYHAFWLKTEEWDGFAELRGRESFFFDQWIGDGQHVTRLWHPALSMWTRNDFLIVPCAKFFKEAKRVAQVIRDGLQSVPPCVKEAGEHEFYGIAPSSEQHVLLSRDLWEMLGMRIPRREERRAA